MRALACASALALAAPVAAQQAEDDMDVTSRSGQGDANMMGQSWQDVTTPSIRFIQRDAQGDIIFDSAGTNLAPGADDPEMREAIERADGETSFATDSAEPGWTREAGGDMAGMGADDVGDVELTVVENEPSEQRQELAASPVPNRTEDGTMDAMAQDGASTPGQMPGPINDGESMMATVDETTEMGIPGSSAMGDDAMDGMVTTSSGMQIDMDAFAREMFEQGYRRGYVSGLTEMRTRAVRQMQEQRQQSERAQYRQRLQEQSREQRRAMDEVLDRQDAPRMGGMQMQDDGSVIIMLPAGMTPQQFMQGLAAQSQ
jgi:hypothetical protein